MKTLKKGFKAYYDTITCGLVPCVVLSVREEKFGRIVDIEITEDTKAYKKGYKTTDFTRYVVPVKAIRKNRFSVTILPYNSEIDNPEG